MIHLRYNCALSEGQTEEITNIIIKAGQTLTTEIGSGSVSFAMMGFEINGVTGTILPVNVGTITSYGFYTCSDENPDLFAKVKLFVTNEGSGAATFSCSVNIDEQSGV